MKDTFIKKCGAYRHGNLREAILATSLHVIGERGIENFSIREVAKKIGVTHQAPYRHFKDKATLLAALAQDGYEKLYIEMNKATEGALDPLNQLHKLAESYLLWAFNTPDHFRLMFSHNAPDFSTSEDLQIAAKNISALVTHIIIRNQKANIIRDNRTESIARQFWAAVHGISILFINGQFKPIDNDLNQAKLLIEEMIFTIVCGMKSS